MLITVVAYKQSWPITFAEESKHLQNILGDIVKVVHHIGSTAVPGLMAKPIIDIMPEVINLERLDTKSKAFEELGYEVMGEFGIAGRRYFRKGGDSRTHQIHAFQFGDTNIHRHLVFRDYLIAHDEIAQEYGSLKLRIAQSCHNDIEKYCNEKDPFIKYHEAKALEWYQSEAR